MVNLPTRLRKAGGVDSQHLGLRREVLDVEQLSVELQGGGVVSDRFQELVAALGGGLGVNSSLYEAVELVVVDVPLSELRGTVRGIGSRSVGRLVYLVVVRRVDCAVDGNCTPNEE